MYLHFSLSRYCLHCVIVNIEGAGEIFQMFAICGSRRYSFSFSCSNHSCLFCLEYWICLNYYVLNQTLKLNRKNHLRKRKIYIVKWQIHFENGRIHLGTCWDHFWENGKLQLRKGWIQPKIKVGLIVKFWSYECRPKSSNITPVWGKWLKLVKEKW